MGRPVVAQVDTMSMLSEPVAAEGPTLAAVIDCLGLEVLAIFAAPAGLDVSVGEMIIHDPVDPAGHVPGELLLAVGVDPEHHALVELLHHVGEAHGAAVIAKLRSPPSPELLEAARASGVALLGIRPEMAWGQLHVLLRTATATVGKNAGDVPMGDLFALAEAIAGMVGGPTTIEDRRSNVIAYSRHVGEIDEARRATILGLRVPDEWVDRLERAGVFRRLWSEEAPVRVDLSDAGMSPRLVIGVRAGGEILGSIWVQESDRPLDDDAEAALVEAARIAALHLIRHRSSEDLERSRRTDLLRSVLGGRATPEVLAGLLGTTPSSAVTVVAVELVAGNHPLDQPLDAATWVIVERAVSLVNLHCEAYRKSAACAAVGRVMYVVLVDPGPPDRTALRAFAAQMAERISATLPNDLRVGVGSTSFRLADLLTSRRDADRTLRALAENPGGGAVATIEEVRASTILAELTDIASREPRLLAGKLDILRSADREHQTSYVATLRAYLDAFGDIPTAAKLICIHPNTFRYRLRRLTEISGLDLDNPAERLVAELQLHIASPDRPA